MSESVCVCVCAAFVRDGKGERERDTVCVREKGRKKRKKSLPSSLHLTFKKKKKKKIQPAEDRGSFYENRLTVQPRWQTERQRETDRAGRRRDRGPGEYSKRETERERKRSGREKNSEDEKREQYSESQWGEEGPVQFHWFEPQGGGERAGNRGGGRFERETERLL